jgi:hypothetical protein
MSKKIIPVLKIYCLCQPLLMTEWRSILSDKFAHSLPINLELTDDPSQASVIAWDGMISAKMQRLLPEIEHMLKGKTLLVMGEAQTLLNDHPFVRIFEAVENAPQLTGWSVLPEELLESLMSCYQKSSHV